MNGPAKVTITHAIPHSSAESAAMLGGAQTAGTLGVLIGSDPPGTGPELHFHTREDELFLIVEGEYSFFAEGRWTDVSAGALVYLPKGSPHCYRNIGMTIGRRWIITTPSGFEQFLPCFGEEMSNPNGPDVSRMNELLQQYGLVHLGAPPPR